MSPMLHGYWRSSAADRVRTAPSLLGLDFYRLTPARRMGSRREAGERALAPIGLVPALEADDGQVLTQSLAILEWLEVQHPDPPLLPDNPLARVVVKIEASEHGWRFCSGNTSSLADFRRMPQIRTARSFEVGLDAIPTWLGIEANCQVRDAIDKVAPEVQPDTDGRTA